MADAEQTAGMDLGRIRAEAMEFANVGIYRYRFSGEIIFIDRGSLRLLDLQDDYPDPDALAGRNIGTLFEHIDPPYSLRKTVSEHGSVRFFEYHYRTLSGKERWVYHNSYLVWDEERREQVIQVIAQDITQIKRAVLELEDSENRYRQLAESTSQGLCVIGLRGLRVLYANPSSAAILGLLLEEVLALEGERLWACVHTDDRPEVIRFFTQSEPSMQRERTHDLRVVRKNGDVRWLTVSGSAIRFAGQAAFQIILTDITARKQREGREREEAEKLQQAQKLKSLSILAGGVAHDFNNLLVGVLGNAEIALMDLEREHPARESVLLIRTAAMQAAELANQMLAYSGRGSFVKTNVTLRSVVESMGHLLRTSVSQKAVLTFDFADRVAPVRADVSQLRQIVMNLVVNAAEAISAGTGAIAIRTGMQACTRSDLDTMWLGRDLPCGSYAYVEVADTGCGMDADIASRVFDPFFTTKFTGRGLGLAAVLGIVRGHQGAIDLRTESDRGTTFRVLLPAAAGKPPMTATPSTGRPSGTFTGVTVMLVDDEEIVRAVGRRLLERLGAEVVTAEDGRQALTLFQADPQKFDCVLLDLTMPRLGGEALLPELKRIREDVCVVLSSGYSEQELLGRFEGKGIAGLIKKPYESEKLREVMLSAMGDAQPSMI